MSADLIFINVNILSMDSAVHGKAVVAVKKDRIFAVLEKDKYHEFEDTHTLVIDCKGKTLLPGFIDAHCHLSGFAESFVTLDLSPGNNVRSISDIKAKIRAFSENLTPGSWIRGKGYNEFYLEEKRHPTLQDLDDVSPHHPVKLSHRTGHAHVLNSVALKEVGITMVTLEPPGGVIHRDIHTGEPDGLLFEMGAYLSKRVPPLGREDLDRGMKLANQKLVSYGITSIQDASIQNSITHWDRFCFWKESILLKPRISMMLGMDHFSDYQKKSLPRKQNENHLRISAVKIILDEITDRLHPSQSDLNAMVTEVHRSGLQVAIHAVEERAVEAATKAIGYALEMYPKKDHRHHIEHCSVCPPELAKLIAKNNIVVVTQPPFIYYNGDRYLETVSPDQLKHLYPLKTLIESNVTVAGSSDCPVVPAKPLVGVYAAVTRKSGSGESVLPGEKISIQDALEMYTLNAAKTTFEEGIKGTITPGKLADFVLLDRDPTDVPPEEIKDINVEMTIIGGEVVYGNF